MLIRNTRWTAPLAAAGALMLMSAMPAAAAPAQSFGPLQPLPLERSGDLTEIRHRRWHRPHCRWVKRCWWGYWGKRRCTYVHRCW